MRIIDYLNYIHKSLFNSRPSRGCLFEGVAYSALYSSVSLVVLIGKGVQSDFLNNQQNNINFVEFETVKMKSQRLNGKLGSALLEYDFITGRFK